MKREISHGIKSNAHQYLTFILFADGQVTIQVFEDKLQQGIYELRILSQVNSLNKFI